MPPETSPRCDALVLQSPRRSQVRATLDGVTESREDEYAFVPELVPRPLGGISASRKLKKSEWTRIRKEAMDACDCRCAVCGTHVEGGKDMPCDEVWEYNEGPEDNAALLARVRMLCRECDTARHFDRSANIGYGDQARATLARLNNLTDDEVRQLQGEIVERWSRRSELKWSVNVNPELLERYPALAVLVGTTRYRPNYCAVTGPWAPMPYCCDRMRISNKQPECLNCGRVPSLEAGHGGIPMCIREPSHEGQHSWEFALRLDDAGKAPWEAGYTTRGRQLGTGASLRASHRLRAVENNSFCPSITVPLHPCWFAPRFCPKAQLLRQWRGSVLHRDREPKYRLY